MAYEFKNSKGTTYYLHAKKTASANGKERILFYFSKEIKADAIDALPADRTVVEMKTGMPVLKKV
jgi:hypothetical protein